MSFAAGDKAKDAGEAATAGEDDDIEAEQKMEEVLPLLLLLLVSSSVQVPGRQQGWCTTYYTC